LLTNRIRFVATKDAMECVLLFVLIGQKSALLALMRANRGSDTNKKFQEFLAGDSNDPDFRARACKNAFRLISQHRYSLSCALFLLANEISSAMDVAANRLGDIMLAVAIARLHSKEPSAAFSEQHEQFIVEALDCKFPAATAGNDSRHFALFQHLNILFLAALLHRQGRNEDMLRHLLLVCNRGFNHSDAAIAPVLHLLPTFDLMLFVHELLLMPQVQRWKQLLPSVPGICSNLSGSCEQLCVLCCRMLTVASGSCIGPHVAFVMLKAFHQSAAEASVTRSISPSLQSFFLSSLCGWLGLDPIDVSYSMSSIPSPLADTLMRLVRNEEGLVGSSDDVHISQSLLLSQHTAHQSRRNFRLLPSNITVSQRWQLLMSAASANVSSCFRFATSVQSCVLALCFPSVTLADSSSQCSSFLAAAVQFLLSNCPLRDNEDNEQHMLQLCSSWLNIVHERSPRQQVAPVAPTGTSSAGAGFWALCAGENVLQLLQAAVPPDGEIAASVQPCRLLLLQEMRSCGISISAANAFVFERFALPPHWLQDVVALLNSAAATAAVDSARTQSASIQAAQAKPQERGDRVFSGNAKAISNVLGCRRRVAGSGSGAAPVFGPLEEVACTREMIRSIALVPALGEPCVVAAGEGILAEIKLSPKGASAAPAAAAPAAASKSIEAVVSQGLKKFGNSLFAKVRWWVGFDDQLSCDGPYRFTPLDLQRLLPPCSTTRAAATTSPPSPHPAGTACATIPRFPCERKPLRAPNCPRPHPPPLHRRYVTGGNGGSQSLWSSGSSCALSHFAPPWPKCSVAGESPPPTLAASVTRRAQSPNFRTTGGCWPPPSATAASRCGSSGATARSRRCARCSTSRSAASTSCG